jgi:endonuclease I
VTESPFNLILLPSVLNNYRSNFKYVDEKDAENTIKAAAEAEAEEEATKRVPCCRNCQCTLTCVKGTLFVGQKTFAPPDLFKGIISRSILRSVNMYPNYRHIIDAKCLSLKTAVKWINEFPITENEILWFDLVTRLNKNKK